MTGRQHPHFAWLVRAFSPPLAPSFGERREDNNLTSQKLVRLFSPRKPRFHRRYAPLKVSLWRRMSADATGIFILTGDNALLLTAFALAFSPVSPHFRRRVRGS